MTSFFAGVKNWLFGERLQDPKQPGPSHEAQHAGQKRSRRQPQEPVLQEVRMPTGGIQGFNWFVSSLRVDADGDAAHDFLTEQQMPAAAATNTSAAAAAAAAATGQCPTAGSSIPGQESRSEHSSSTAQGQTAAGLQQQQQQQQQRFKLHGVQQGNLLVRHS